MKKSLFNIKLLNYISFILTMTEKEIKARYKNAALGFLWILLNPLFQMIIIGFIFQNIIKTPIANYYLFLFSGLLPWNFFSYSFTKATSSFVFERELIQKAKFPHEAIPLSIVFSNFFHFIVSLVILIIFLLISGNFQIGSLLISFFYLTLSLIWLLAFTCGISLFTASVNVKYRDVNFFVQALSILWFYATPVMYSVELLPKNFIPFFRFNPVAYPFEMFRSSLLSTSLPPTNILLTNLLISLFVVILGIIIFKKENKYFSDWL